MYLLFENITDKNKSDAINTLIKDSTASPAFYFLVILSVIMATYGLILNNASVVIGSMLIAPIMSPMLSLALGITLSDRKLRNRSIHALLKSVFWSVGVSTLVTLLLWNITGTETFQTLYNPEVISRTQPSMAYFFIAVIAGLATSFARVKPELNEALPGTAIAVALVPPLATIGVGVATLNAQVALGALSMFALNAVGIVIASIIMFSLMKIYTKRKIAQQVLTEVEKEQEQIVEQYEKKQEAKITKQEPDKKIIPTDRDEVIEEYESSPKE